MPGARRYLAEAIGTFIIVLAGLGIVHVAVLTPWAFGMGHVAMVWGAAVGLAVLVTAARSGAHLNPAITLALTAFRRFSAFDAGLYILSQLLGATLAALLVHAIFSASVESFERREGITRGAPGSEVSAMMYGDYFPNPAGKAGVVAVSKPMAFAAEAAATAILAFVIFALTDPGRREKPALVVTAVAVGVTVAVMVCMVAPLTQAGLNPARDLGPRLVACLLGWGDVAIPGPRGGWLSVYVAGPVAGALAGAGIYEVVLGSGTGGEGGVRT